MTALTPPEEETQPGAAVVAPPILTADAPVRLAPVIVTFVPTFPLVGLKLVIEGFGTSASATPAIAKATIISAEALNTRLRVPMDPYPSLSPVFHLERG